MQFLYTNFYRLFGVRRFSEFVSPRLHHFTSFCRNALYHHLTDDEELHIDPSKPWFKDYMKRIPIDFVYRSDVMVGNPREKPFVPQRFVMPFIKEHREFRYVKDAADVVQDQRTLLVLNYNGLKFAYRFVHTPMSSLNQWLSYHQTLYSHIGQLTQKSDKQHFVIVDPIDYVPSFSLLNNFGSKQGLALARLFNTPQKLLLLHLFNFIKADTRELSVFNQIPLEGLKRVNIVFLTKNGQASVLNLSYLHSWIKGHENVSGIKLSAQYDEKVVCRAFLKFLLVISASAPEDAVEDIPQEEAQIHDENDLLEQPEEQDEFDDQLPEVTSGILPHSSSLKTQFNKNKDIVPVLPEKEEPDFDVKSLLSKLDEDLEILEHKNHQDLQLRGITIKNGDVVETEPPKEEIRHEEVHTEVFTTYTPNEALKKKLSKALQSDDLNPAAYKKALAEASKYEKMPDPYGSSKPVIERVQIKPHELLIDKKKIEHKDAQTVFDKSMNQSSLNVFTHDYVQHHLKNDILKMVGGLQKGGVIVQNHEVEIEHTIMGSAELHRLELKPIDGAASSVWFKLPVIEEDGTYVAAGNRYKIRKQLIDLNIRKISPTEVALSSYYGKTFVSTESKVSNSESEWIWKQINLAAFEGSDWIKDVVPGDTFDSYRKTPYIYGMLSKQFISFKAGDLNLRFDGTNPDIKYPNLIQERIKQGLTWCGTKPTKEQGDLPVFIDKDNRFYVLDKGTLVNLGDIYHVLHLDPQKAPIRFSELALFKKNVPVGIILGYRLGWSKLLALLQVKPRFVEPKKRLNLLPDEYPIVFNDGTYIFSRKDKLATMILAGFLDYSKVTKNYNVKDAEHQDVYLNLMSSKGLGAIYIREIDMLFDYFVDPISEEILKDLGEPTTFDGLLLRSTELLTTYDHPSSQDGAYTRIRGYERLAGSVYKEMTTAIRQFRSKNIAGRSKIDISPWKVWQSINEDPTKMMVPEINPIQDLKNDEGVTYVGEGGRSKDAINKASRSFHKEDIGVISEATVDSSDVGVNIYTSADPTFKNLRGLKDQTQITNTNRSSTSVLLAPGAIHDD